ncbi:MAG: hypothetical protein QOF10_378 [Kribbellaceae bacterium]|jgi:hypothetical protein|nr:hypothetical protein [Kribbellaceae bacterium]
MVTLRAFGAAVLVGLISLTVGCSGDDGGAAASPPPAASTPTPTPTSPTPTALPTPTPAKTTPRVPTLVGQSMRAKDGRNTSHCLKKSCEVLVSTGSQFRIKTSKDFATITIVAVSPQGLTIGLYGDSGFGGQTSSGSAPGEFVAYNEVHFIALAVSGKSAVLRLTR